MSKGSIVVLAALVFIVYLAATGRLANIVTIVTSGKVIEGNGKQAIQNLPGNSGKATAPATGGGSSGGGGGGAGGGF